MNNVFWMVATGCNSRHLLDAKAFDTLKDAQEYKQTINKDTAYSLTRHEESDKYATSVQIQVLQERVL